MEDEKQIKINLGCQGRPLREYTNHDFVAGDDIALSFDLNGTWPISDKSVDLYRAQLVLQRLEDPIHFFTEVQRTLKPNGIIKLSVPHANNSQAMVNPRTKRAYYPETFSLVNDRLEVTKVNLTINPFFKRFPFKDWLLPKLSTWLNNVYSEFTVVMRNLTDQEYTLRKIKKKGLK